MVESASKGMILMYAKEAILKVLNKSDISPGTSPIPVQHAAEPVDSLLLPDLLPMLAYCISYEMRPMRSSTFLVQAWRELLLVLEAACARCPSWGP